MVNLRISFFLISLLLLPFSLRAGDAGENGQGKFDLFLLIGQSNMAGRGPMSPEDKRPIRGAWMLDAGGEWVPARNPIHFDKPRVAGVGPAASFVREYVATHPGRRAGVIPCALGGSRLSQWMPGQKLYRRALARTRIALKNGKLVGILWHQGESDSCSRKAIEGYPPQFRKMIAQLRKDLDAEAVPVVVGEIGYFLGKPADDFNAMLRQTAGELPLCGLASSRGLKHRGDTLHFSTPAQKILGKRYFKAWIDLSKRKK